MRARLPPLARRACRGCGCPSRAQGLRTCERRCRNRSRSFACIKPRRPVGWKDWGSQTANRPAWPRGRIAPQWAQGVRTQRGRTCSETRTRRSPRRSALPTALLLCRPVPSKWSCWVPRTSLRPTRLGNKSGILGPSKSRLASPASQTAPGGYNTRLQHPRHPPA